MSALVYFSNAQLNIYITFELYLEFKNRSIYLPSSRVIVGLRKISKRLVFHHPWRNQNSMPLKLELYSIVSNPYGRHVLVVSSDNCNGFYCTWLYLIFSIFHMVGKKWEGYAYAINSHATYIKVLVRQFLRLPEPIKNADFNVLLHICVYDSTAVKRYSTSQYCF